MRKLLIASVTIFVALLLAGADPPPAAPLVGGPVRLVTMNVDQDQLQAISSTTPPNGWMQRTLNTFHLAATNPPQLFPPSPCRGLAISWNNVLARNTSGGGQGGDVFQALTHILQQASVHQCSFNVVLVEPDNNPDTPDELYSIQPIP